MPFAVAARDGVLTLTLDTPGSAINIFNHATAEQLLDVLASVTPATTRAIVFQTAKTNSFINGVGLLLAHASQSYDDVVRASTLPSRAYRAVREAPVPTIAVVQGNCYGCGVEFVLNCRYRIAADTCETHFYMTELNDYLFIPLFGSTWNLPQAVGLGHAIDLLLWGERWGAGTAWEHGLVDEVAPYEELTGRTRRFVERVVAAEQPSRRRGLPPWGPEDDRVMGRTRQRIASLPPQYQQVYTDGLELLEAGARQTHTYGDHQGQELRCSAASALSPIGKAAYAFFYLRQIASQRAAGRPRPDLRPVTLSLDVGPGDDACAFAADLGRRKLPGLAFGDAGTADFRLVAGRGATSGTRNGHCPAVGVQVSLAPAPLGDAELYAPTYGAGGRLIELATRGQDGPGLAAEDAARLAHTLQRLGFEVARTTPGETFVSNRLLVAYLAPLVRFVEVGDDVGVLNHELRDTGFVRRPHDVLAAFERGALAQQLGTALGRAPAGIEPLLATLESDRYADRGDAAVVDALCISLLDAVLTARQRGEVRDTSIVDLIARELLDFPRHLCSVSTWLKKSRVARALDGGPRVRSLVTEAALASARSFVAAGREFYR